MGTGPPAHVEMTFCGCRGTHFLVPWTVIFARSLKNRQVPSSGGRRACTKMPGIAVVPGLLERCNVSSRCRFSTCKRISVTAVSTSPLKNMQMAAARGVVRCLSFPRGPPYMLSYAYRVSKSLPPPVHTPVGKCHINTSRHRVGALCGTLPVHEQSIHWEKFIC